MLTVYIEDHRQTAGGLSKGRAAADNRRKLLQRALELRALDKTGDYLPPGRMPALIAQLWPDASQDPASDLYNLLRSGEEPHQSPWTHGCQNYLLPRSLLRLFTEQVLQMLDARSSLVAGALAALLIATAPEEFGIPECTTTIKAAGLSGAYRWDIILPNSSRVSMLTYKAIVAVRYPELVVQEGSHTNIGHFVPHEATVMQGGFRTVLWNVPKDLRLAVEDIVSFCHYLRNCYPSLRQGVTSQLLILCNRTAVHNLLLQHGFQTEWHGAMRVSTLKVLRMGTTFFLLSNPQKLAPFIVTFASTNTPATFIPNPTTFIPNQRERERRRMYVIYIYMCIFEYIYRYLCMYA